MAGDKTQPEETSDFGAPARWLLVGFVVAMFLAIGVIGFLYQPGPPDTICSNAEARCSDRSDASAQ